ncbi:trypsin-like peptidase domain-containing protein [Bacteroidota bacterium]
MKKILITLLVAFAGGIISVGAYKLFEDKQSERIAMQTEEVPVHLTSQYSGPPVIGPDFTTAAERTIHTVVNITAEFRQKSSVYDDFFDIYEFFGMRPSYRNMPIIATGSGVIISNDGYIVTNNHVVQESEKITVTLNNKRSYDAEIIGRDPSTDLALLKIDEKGLPYVVYGNSDNVRIGEWVLAVGNPFNLTSTVTAGIVSAKARDINILGNTSSYSAIESYIQTDAAVNKGNSGGALVNTVGELVGINAAIASSTGSYTGYSFAIPVNIVKKVVDDLQKYGQVQRALLGVSIRELNSELASEKGIDKIEGVYIAGLSGDGAAKDAGINEGDVIIKINDIEVNSPSELLGRIGQQRPGDKVKVTVNRKGSIKNFNIVLRNENGTTAVVKKPESNVIAVLGATFDKPSANEMDHLGISSGVKVKRLETGKFQSAGIKEGFIITRIDRRPISSVDDVMNAMKYKRGGVLIEGVYPNGVRAYYGIGM